MSKYLTPRECGILWQAQRINNASEALKATESRESYLEACERAGLCSTCGNELGTVGGYSGCYECLSSATIAAHEARCGSKTRETVAENRMASGLGWDVRDVASALLLIVRRRKLSLPTDTLEALLFEEGWRVFVRALPDPPSPPIQDEAVAGAIRVTAMDRTTGVRITVSEP